MKNYLFILFIGVVALACTSDLSKKGTTHQALFWSQNHHPVIDKALAPVLLQYQELLRGLSNNDTAYVMLKTRELIQITDSLQLISMVKDTNTQIVFTNGLEGINNELQGLLRVNERAEQMIAVNIISLELRNLLAQVGYQEKPIYWYVVENDDNDDVYYWLSGLKQMKDPFHLDHREMVMASQVLQEL